MICSLDLLRKASAICKLKENSIFIVIISYYFISMSDDFSIIVSSTTLNYILWQ